MYSAASSGGAGPLLSNWWEGYWVDVSGGGGGHRNHNFIKNVIVMTYSLIRMEWDRQRYMDQILWRRL